MLYIESQLLLIRFQSYQLQIVCNNYQKYIIKREHLQDLFHRTKSSGDNAPLTLFFCAQECYITNFITYFLIGPSIKYRKKPGTILCVSAILGQHRVLKSTENIKLHHFCFQKDQERKLKYRVGRWDLCSKAYPQALEYLGTKKALVYVQQTHSNTKLLGNSQVLSNQLLEGARARNSSSDPYHQWWTQTRTQVT